MYNLMLRVCTASPAVLFALSARFMERRLDQQFCKTVESCVFSIQVLSPTVDAEGSTENKLKRDFHGCDGKKEFKCHERRREKEIWFSKKVLTLKV